MRCYVIEDFLKHILVKGLKDYIRNNTQLSEEVIDRIVDPTEDVDHKEGTGLVLSHGELSLITKEKNSRLCLPDQQLILDDTYFGIAISGKVPNCLLRDTHISQAKWVIPEIIEPEEVWIYQTEAQENKETETNELLEVKNFCNQQTIEPEQKPDYVIYNQNSMNNEPINMKIYDNEPLNMSMNKTEPQKNIDNTSNFDIMGNCTNIENDEIDIENHETENYETENLSSTVPVVYNLHNSKLQYNKTNTTGTRDLSLNDMEPLDISFEMKKVDNAKSNLNLVGVNRATKVISSEIADKDNFDKNKDLEDSASQVIFNDSSTNVNFEKIGNRSTVFGCQLPFFQWLAIEGFSALENSVALYTSSVFDNQKCMSSKLNLCFKNQKEDLQNDLENNYNLLTKLNIIQSSPKPSDLKQNELQKQ